MNAHNRQIPAQVAPDLQCFKTYDVRGRIDEELDDRVAFRIGQAFSEVMGPGSVVVGHDCRTTSPELAAALIDGLRKAGVEVFDIGQAGTEEVYFATTYLDAGGGIEVTASHNPIEYNGMKFVGRDSRPVSEDEFAHIHNRARLGIPLNCVMRARTEVETRPAFARKVCDFVDATWIRPFKIVVNAGNGVAGPAFDAIVTELARRGADLEVIRIFHEPDPSFPNGIPNPLLPENRAATAEAVQENSADLGIAWDGDFDRCFLFDETGAFVDGEYVVGLLARAFLKDEPGSTIVHDPRVIWSTQTAVQEEGGQAVMARTGHAFVKQTMRETEAIYGGEMSAHHYFRDFMCCDSGMIPWLKVLELMSRTKQSLAELVSTMRHEFPSSGEINFEVSDARRMMEHIRTHFEGRAVSSDMLDGLSMSFDDWRMNLRPSNTEPLLRLNVEARGDRALLEAARNEITRLCTM